MKVGDKCKRAIAWNNSDVAIMWSDDTYTIDGIDKDTVHLLDSDGNIYVSFDIKDIKLI